ncbi:hypothetical protein MGLY_13550 [Neomoorella glycerini]|uniref:Uncharacterized protein n=1 Tax=Neomoorella glycerini TaxID=55779 RepID=A0A6I5ZQA4_9FIRM|nr:hypothetical protein MGLY_13550 [Moorella glycerini]
MAAAPSNGFNFSFNFCVLNFIQSFFPGSCLHIFYSQYCPEAAQVLQVLFQIFFFYVGKYGHRTVTKRTFKPPGSYDTLILHDQAT